MATLSICLRSKIAPVRRFRLQDVDLLAPVVRLKALVQEKSQLHQEFQLVHCGRSLKDDRTLEAYGIRSGATLYVMPSITQEPVEVVPLDKAEVDQAMATFHAAMSKHRYRSSVENMLSKKETLESIVAATPGLSSDPVALAMLQNPELLPMLAHPDHVHKVLEQHPTLGHAVIYIAAAVTEETAHGSGPSASSSRAAYSLDQMSDDEDLMDIQPSSSHPANRHTITSQQLAAALAMASNSAPAPPQPPDQETSSQSSQITADFLRQALSQVAPPSDSASSASASAFEGQSNSFEAQMAQLRAMGIQDEAVARHALEASNGDLMVAIQILFGDPNA